MFDRSPKCSECKNSIAGEDYYVLRKISEKGLVTSVFAHAKHFDEEPDNALNGLHVGRKNRKETK